MMNTLKNYLFAVLMVLSFCSVTAMTISGKDNSNNIIYIEDVISQPVDVIMVEIMIDNSDDFVAFSFDLIFPDEIMAYDPNPSLTFLTDRAADHVFFATPKGDGVLFVFAFSPSNTPFLGNSGSVINLGFSVNAPSENNSYPINLFEAILSDENGQDILDESLDGMLFVVPEDTDIPENLVLDNIEVAEGEVKCFNATQSIITAGEDAYFTVDPGADASLIAGENIKMLQGTHIQEGATLHAYIAPDGPFCGEADKHFLTVADNGSTESKNTETTNISEIETQKDPSFKVYPNPTTDNFFLELFRFEPDDNPIAEIYNMQGRLIIRRELQTGQEHLFNLDEEQAGIYLIRVIQDDFIGVQRLIKR